MNSAPAPDTTEKVIEYYQNLQRIEEAKAESIAGRWTLVGIIRGVLFLGALFTLILGFAHAWGIHVGWWVLSGGLFAVFVGIAIYHENMHKALHQANLLSKMHRESLARVNRDWGKIRVPQIEIPRSFRPISKDLDLLGDSSVYKLLGTTRTPLGTEMLQDWIISGALPDVIASRQAAVGELRNEFEWRLKFRLLCEKLAAGQSGPNRFVNWCESPNWFNSNRVVLLWACRIIGAISFFSILLLVLGVLPLTVAGPALIVTAAINFVLSIIFAGPIHDVFNQVSSHSGEASHYVGLFDMVAEYPAKSERLKELQASLKKSSQSAQSCIQRIGTLTWFANLRRQGMFFIPYMIFEFLFFYDVHALHLLERWKAKHGGNARSWFTDLAEWEAITSLAKFAGDHPAWNFPTVAIPESPQTTMVKGVKVGHPLLDDARVPNDVQMGPPGTVLLVTGSNMSGKSTLLRSVGVNIVLAQMGSVVCAESLTMPPIHIETSMRIDDSLADGVSFFMAELKRLKEIVDVAKQHDENNPKRMLFLLDEILQGTNSRERQIAVSRVVRKLIDEQAIGAISTHDLDLATTDELRAACKTVHFSEHFEEVDGKKKMTFDYQMKTGIAETTNALKLLEIVGLGED